MQLTLQIKMNSDCCKMWLWIQVYFKVTDKADNDMNNGDTEIYRWKMMKSTKALGHGYWFVIQTKVIWNTSKPTAKPRSKYQ